MTRGMAGADAVFHLAWAGLDMRGPILSLRRNNVGGLQCTARAAAAAGVRRFVFVSTEAVLFGAPIEEEDEGAPFPEPARAAFGAMNPYSVTKARACHSVCSPRISDPPPAARGGNMAARA